jgi:hypothetical protein
MIELSAVKTVTVIARVQKVDGDTPPNPIGAPFEVAPSSVTITASSGQFGFIDGASFVPGEAGATGTIEVSVQDPANPEETLTGSVDIKLVAGEAVGSVLMVDFTPEGAPASVSDPATPDPDSADTAGQDAPEGAGESAPETPSPAPDSDNPVDPNATADPSATNPVATEDDGA